MSSAIATPPDDRIETADQRLVTYGVPWSHFEVQLALRGDGSVPRMAYLDKTLELLRPSKEHERIRSWLGRLVEAYALEAGLDLSPYGSWTLKHPPAEAGIEPDECYIVGRSDQEKPLPDLAIEVVWTSSGIDKLEIYRRLGVGEVWFWRNETIEAYLLVGDRFERAERSRLFRGLALDLLVKLLDLPTALQAVRALRAALAG